MDICYMQDRGALLEAAVRASGLSLTHVASKLKISRNTLYQMFNRPDLSVEELLRVGKIINHDFSQDLRELSETINILANSVERPTFSPLATCREELTRTQNLLNSTQHKLIAAMEVVAAYQQKYGNLSL